MIKPCHVKHALKMNFQNIIFRVVQVKKSEIRLKSEVDIYKIPSEK